MIGNISYDLDFWSHHQFNKFQTILKSIINLTLQIYWKNPNKLGYAPNKIKRKETFKFNLYRPWETGFKEANPPTEENAKKYLVEPILKWSFFR